MGRRYAVAAVLSEANRCKQDAQQNKILPRSQFSLKTWSPSQPISNACHSWLGVARGSNIHRSQSAMQDVPSPPMNVTTNRSPCCNRGGPSHIAAGSHHACCHAGGLDCSRSRADRRCPVRPAALCCPPPPPAEPVCRSSGAGVPEGHEASAGLCRGRAGLRDRPQAPPCLSRALSSCQRYLCRDTKLLMTFSRVRGR